MYKKFIKLWCDNRSNQEIADALGIPYQAVSRMSRKLRDGGVNLPERKYSHTDRLDADRLNEYIKQLTK